MRKLISVFSVALLVCGCTLIPEYQRPVAPIPEKLPVGSDAKEETSILPWREFIQDAKLRQVIELALENNRDLRIATLNVEQVRALYKIQREELYPSLYATGGGTRNSSSLHLIGRDEPRTTTVYQANLGLLSWEIDFFGKLRSLSEKALQEFFATEQARRGAQILLVSSVANSYLAYGAELESLKLSQETYKSQKDAFDLVQRQFDQGQITELDLRRAQIPCEIARRTCAVYRQRIATAANALRLLAGVSIPENLLPGSLSEIDLTPQVAAGISSEILLQRPDVLGAEHQLLAAYATIGAARAAFFPNISLTSTLGTASTELHHLFENGTRTWSFAPQLAMPIFDARTWSAHRVSKVQRDLAVATYEKAIQNAFCETADALALCANMKEQILAQTALVEASETAYRLARTRYEKGIDGYLSVLDAQRTMFDAQLEFVNLRLADHSSRLQLYAVLGGGAL